MNGDCVVESNNNGDVVDLQHELKEVEEKFRKAMIANAQLDNDKAAQTYQLELLKDRWVIRLLLYFVFVCDMDIFGDKHVHKKSESWSVCIECILWYLDTI